MDDRPTVGELENLCTWLTLEEGDDPRQELPLAAAHGGEAVCAVIDAWMVDRAGREVIDGLE